jgi:hypothetical protein
VAALGVYVSWHDDWAEPLGLNVQVTPGLKAPCPPGVAPKFSVPAGVVGVALVSVAVAVHVVASPTTTEVGEHDTTVDVPLATPASSATPLGPIAPVMKL